MIPHGVEIYVGLEPIDLRWGFDTLAGIIEERIGRRARSGALFVFFGRRRSALKIVFYDGSGMCVLYKRLDEGTFRIPEPLDPAATSMVIEERVLDDLLDGIDVVGRDEVAQARARRRRAH